MTNTKIAIYFMPGMAASTSIFQNIVLPADIFDVHLLEWLIPKKGISLSDYAKLMCAKVKEENPVLIGVSFGGMLVQEMANHIKNKTSNYHIKCKI